MNKKNNSGFTLIELLIVIAIIAILASAAFVAYDSLTRFKDSRDSARWSDVSAISEAIQLNQVDKGGYYLTAITNTTVDTWYMIVNGSTMVSGCDNNNLSCDIDVATTTACVNLAGLVTEGYLGAIPVSESSGTVTWDDGSGAADEGTGYALKRDASGSITVQACESENTEEIKIIR